MFLHTSEINLNKMEIILFQATNIIPFPLNNSGILTRELEHFGCIGITTTPPTPLSHMP